MQSFLITLFKYAFIALIFPLAITFALATKTSAQSAADRRRIERDQEQREWELRNVGKVQKVDLNVVPTNVSLKQVKEDYEGIQSANNAILKMLSVKKSVDFKVVAEAAGEIKKRAGRLKSSLILLQMADERKGEKKSLGEIEPQEIRASLLSLDATIISFVTNPIFQNFGQVVDSNNSTKARDNLDAIISLSERIKRSVERAMKTSR